MDINDIIITEEDLKNFKVDLFKYVPLFTRKDTFFKMIYNSQQTELEKIKFLIDDFIKQKNIYTATWSLDLWEEEWGIPINKEDSYEIRRARVLAKMRGQGTSTPRMLERVAHSFLHIDDTVKCEPHNEEYYYWLYLNSEYGFPNDISTDVSNAIWQINPCHLEPKFRFRAITKSNIKVVSYGCIGETIRTYPWTVDKIETNTNIVLDATGFKGLEKITNYPNEEVKVDKITYIIDENGNTIVDEKNNDVIE